MIKKTRRFKTRDVWEHLEHALRKTTYSQRLQWLEEADKFVRLLRKKKNYPDLSRKKS